MAGGCEADTEAGTEEAATGAAEGAWLTCGDGDVTEWYRMDTADTSDTRHSPGHSTPRRWWSSAHPGSGTTSPAAPGQETGYLKISTYCLTDKAVNELSRSVRFRESPLAPLATDLLQRVLLLALLPPLLLELLPLLLLPLHGPPVDLLLLPQDPVPATQLHLTFPTLHDAIIAL